MKIGILTFHCAHNYGAVLQCYALQETLKRMGHDVEVIDYRPEYLLDPYKRFNIHRFISKNLILAAKNIVKEPMMLRARLRRYKAFGKFINGRLNLSSRVTASGISSKYDIYIMGSDQIWNPKITQGFEPVYFGNFNFAKGERKFIAYAASMEAKGLNEEARDFLKKSLQNFDAVSVRETQLANMLQPLTGKSIDTVLDPTLLADSSIWNKIAVRPSIKQKYVLVYQVRMNQRTLEIASDIARQMNVEVIELQAWLSVNLHGDKIQCASPEEFLGWIKYSSCVVTTSFHGTAFSIIFNRPFYCIKLDDGSDTRSLSLLRNTGLENRLISKDSNPVFSEIDYGKANKNVSDLRNVSMDFLAKAIEK